MTLGVSNYGSYYSTVGDSYVAQTNRILQLVSDTQPVDYQYDDMSYIGQVNYTMLSASEGLNSLRSYYQQSEDIQFSINAMQEAGDALEQISTRLDIMEGLAGVIEQNQNLSDVQKEGIQEQINFALGEINQIAETTAFENIPLLNGALEETKVYLELTNNNSIDLTEAFNEVTTRALELPDPGYAYVATNTVEDFLESVGDAKDKVDTQLNNIDSYSSHLVGALGDVNGAIMDGSMLSMFSSAGSAMINYDSHQIFDNQLQILLGPVTQSVSFNKTYTERVLDLIS